MRYAKFYVVLFTLAQFVFVGCQPSSSYVTRNEKYANVKFKDKTVIISPVPLDVITVENKDDVEDDFDTDHRTPEAIVQDSLYRRIVPYVRASLWGAALSTKGLAFYMFQTLHDSAAFIKVSLKTKKDEKDTLVDFFVPRKHVFAPQVPNVVVIINRITVGRDFSGRSVSVPHYVPGPTISTPGGTFSGGGMWMGGGGGGASQYLGGVVQFIMWDYDANEPVTYAITDVSETFSLGMTTKTWQSFFRRVGKTLFENSPFEWFGARN
ncbi:MAG: hypothetical protein HY961_21025 [Ignavibacteriae bacterium]|nr:hypothetical protein [Ignavibacteriota bacterium]